MAKFTIKRCILILLSLQLLLSGLTACTGTGNSGDTTDGAGTTTLAEDTAITTAPETTKIDPASIEKIVIELKPTNPYLSFYTGDKAGKSSFATLDGVECLKIEQDGSGFKPYCTMPRISPASGLTTDYKFVRVIYKTNDTGKQVMRIYNNASGNKGTLDTDTSRSGGEWIVSQAADLTDTGIVERFINGQHSTIGVESTNSNAVYYIREIVFFKTKLEAYAYYGDEEPIDTSKIACTFGLTGNAKAPQFDGAGIYSINNEDNTLDIFNAGKLLFGGLSRYVGKVSFTGYDRDYKYVRVLYSAQNPAGEDDIELRIVSDASGQSDIIPGIRNTNGEYRLSASTALQDELRDRFATGKHCSLAFVAIKNGGAYKVKALYFFLSKEAADRFEHSGDNIQVTISGNDIAQYKIVVPENADYTITAAARILAGKIEDLTGNKLPVVTDTAAVSAHEILVGHTNRTESKQYYASGGSMNPVSASYKLGNYEIKVTGSKLVFVSSLMAGYEFAGTLARDTYFSDNAIKTGSVALDSFGTLSGSVTNIANNNGIWASVKNVANPERFTDSFNSDGGYWMEESGQDNWTFSGGVIKSKSVANAVTYLHVFEKNISFEAKLKYTAAASNASMGILTRYVAANAYIKAGYDFANSVWYIEYREGDDFYIARVASQSATLTKDKWYTVKCVTDGNTVTLYVDGSPIVSATGIHHITPGKTGVYAQNAEVSADDVTVILLSGQGKVLRNVVHYVIPGDIYCEGGTVIELTNGTLKYVGPWSISYTSADGGKTWTKDSTQWTTVSGYPNILRLANGSLIQIFTENGKKVAKISTDEGKTWVTKGTICNATKSTGAFASQMNDHITQMSSGRIFWAQGFEGGTKLNGKYAVFCEIYYSDDNGNTWKHSVNTYDIPGNTAQELFGECKILETSDGKLRLYCSWNTYGCIVYSESSDGGLTWGSIQKMTDFVCARSSMQFVRDPYASNNTTYYMVWVYSSPVGSDTAFARSRLGLAKSTDGKNWIYLGDVWRWEAGYTSNGAHVNHLVNPFIMVTRDSIICGSGISERIGTASADSNSSAYKYHQAQRQHIYTIKKDTLVPYSSLPPVK